MKITGEKGHVDIEHNGNIARFYGDLCINGFSAIASTMEWLLHKGSVREEERLELMKAVREHLKKNKFKVHFTDEKGKKLKF